MIERLPATTLLRVANADTIVGGTKLPGETVVVNVDPGGPGFRIEFWARFSVQDAQHAGPQRQRRLRVALGSEHDAGPHRGLAELLQHLSNERQCAGLAERDDGAARLELAEEEDVVDQLTDQLDFTPCLVGERGGILTRERRSLEQREDPGERRPELVRDGRRETGAKLLVGGQLAGRAQVEQGLFSAVDVVRDEQRLVPAVPLEQLARCRPALGHAFESLARAAAGRNHPVLGVEHEQHLAALFDEHPGAFGLDSQRLGILAVLFAVPREEPPHGWLVWRRS